MLKKYISLLLALVTALFLMSGCGEKPGADIKLGMLWGGRNIDDNSINRTILSGMQAAEKELGCQIADPADSGPDTEISHLYNEGCRVIIAPDRSFADAVTTAQDKYPDCTFICVDFAPDPACDNVVGIYYAEHQAGFLAGFATAMELQEGEVGGIFGMAIPPVQRYSWGFQQGVKYANDSFGTAITMNAQNFVYIGKFDEPKAGQKLAAQMYDRGVKCIFLSAELTEDGAIAEAKARRAAEQEVWLVGTDFDRYADGIYDGDKSVFLTSAVKNGQEAILNILKTVVYQSFPGGKSLEYTAAFDGVGIPAENPNLSRATRKAVDKLFAQVKNGDISVADIPDGLIP